MACHETVAQLRAEIKTIHKCGAELVIVGNGKPHWAKSFQEQYQIDTPLFTDPELNSYKAAGLKYGRMRTIGPQTWHYAFKQMKIGLQIKGEPWQQGGAFVIMPNGQLAYEFISSQSIDLPDPEKIMGALKTAVKTA
jgi:peroxiredoxin